MSLTTAPIQPHFFRLPDELAVHILSFLDAKDLNRFAETSRRCQELAQDPVLWKQNITDFFSHLTRQPIITDDILIKALPTCPPLLMRDFSLSVETPRTAPITKKTLQALSIRFPNLQSFCLITTDVSRFSEVHDDDLIEFVRSEPELQAIAITGAPQITEAGYKKITHAAKNLREIWIQSDRVSDSLVQAILHDHPRLRTLKICGRSKKISDATLKAVGENCQEMQECDIRIYRPSFSPGRVKKFLSKLQSVQDLTLQGTKKVSNHIIYNLPCLRRLYLGNCTEITTTAISYLARTNIESLDLLECKNATELSEEVERQKEKKGFSNLKRYEITES